MATVIKYKVYCNTSAQWEYIWRHEADGVPTACPMNSMHDMDTNSISEVDRLESQTIKTEQNIGQGGPQMNPRGFLFTVPAGDASKSFDFPITEALFLKGGRLECDGNVMHDQFDISIVDIDNVWGYGAGLTIPYVGKWPVSKTGVDNIMNSSITETSLQGLYLRLTYYSVGSAEVLGTLGIIAYK